MRDIAVLAQVAADFTLKPVIYEWLEDGLPSIARPRRGAHRPYTPLRMDLHGVHTDVVIGAVLRGAKRRRIEWAIACVEDAYQVTVWLRSEAATTFPANHCRQDLALLEALADLEGAFS